MKINSKLLTIISRAEPKNKKKDFLGKEFTLKNELTLVKGFNIEPRDYKKCRILLLGTIPSKGSKENGFYYLNNNNIFYELLYNAISIKNLKLNSIKSSKDLNALKKNIIIKDLKKYKIALYDIIDMCIRFSSSDNDIIAYKLRTKSHIINILNNSHIGTIFCTSKDSEEYLKECLKDTYIQNENKKGGEIMINSKRIRVVVLHSPSLISFHGKWTKRKVKSSWKREISKALSIKR